MLGIPTPNFCDASSEFDGSTTTGHSNAKRKATRGYEIRHAGKPASTGAEPPPLSSMPSMRSATTSLDRMPDRSEPGTVKHQIRRAQQPRICLPGALLNHRRL